MKMKANRKKLELAMARACMNTADLVKKSAMPRPTVNSVIMGRDVRPATIGKIARALDADVTDILEVEE